LKDKSMSSRLSAALLSGAAILSLTLPASAIEPEAAAQALATAIAGDTKAKVTYESASADGGDVVIAGLTVTNPGDKGTLRFAETVIEAPADGGGGIFTTPSITFTDGAMTGEGGGSIASAKMTDVTVVDPATIPGEAPFQGTVFSTAEATDLKISAKDKPGEVTIASISMENSDIVDNVPRASKGEVADITIPPEAFADSQVGPQTIGYEKLVLDVSWDGSHDPAKKTVDIRDFTLGIQDGGDLTITGIMGNLPSPTEMNDPDAGEKAAKIELHTVTIRYDDNSLAGRVLDVLAQQQGISREEYANQIAGALPFLLAALNNQAFQDQVAGALGTFLKDPQSITVKLQPDAPVSGEEIMGLAGTSPQSIPDRLKATITANTDE
jgi:hypothetical protein